MGSKHARRGGREHLFHLPGSGMNLTLDDLMNGNGKKPRGNREMEVIDPRTNQIIGRMSVRDLLRKFG